MSRNRIDCYDWRYMYGSIKAAERQLILALQSALPPGCRCELSHGYNYWSVEVVEVLDTRPAVRVKGRTGREYIVDASRIRGIGRSA